jgi:hypothetical protein
MGTASLAWACWCLLGQVPSDVFYTNQRDHRVGVEFNDAERSAIKEVRLYSSVDPDHKVWQLTASIPPSQDHFVFRASADGYYWLRVAVVNLQGKQVPENITAGPPNQKMVIDTARPVIRNFQAKRQGNEVVVTWEIQEDNPDVAAFRLEYQPKDAYAALWTAITATPGPTGQARFPTSGGQPIVVRLTMRDLAGNTSFKTVDVGGESINTAAFNPLAGSSGAQTAGATGQSPSGPASGSPPPPVVGGLELSNTIKITPPGGATVGLPPIDPPGVTGGTIKPPVAVEPPPPNTSNFAPGGTGLGQLQPPVKEDKEVIASSKWATPPPAPPATTAAPPSPPAPGPGNDAKPAVAPAPAKTLPPPQYINQPEFVAEYEVTRFGPSGIGSVELYRTRDEGQTWEKYAYDPDVGNVALGVKLQKKVKFQEGDTDGIYGFTIVIKNRANVGRRPPQPGEAPELRIELDTTPPVAQLYKPTPDAKPGHLLLRWDATDKNLTPAPISMEWAEKREGPWQPIGIDLPNTGQFSWSLPEKMPVEVFLRLRVHDLAGNETVAITPNSLPVDLHEPEGHLLRVSVPARQ